MSDLDRFVGVWELERIDDEKWSEDSLIFGAADAAPIVEKSSSRMSGVKGRRPLRGARSAPLTPDIRGAWVGLLIYLASGEMSVNFAGTSRKPFLREFSPTSSELAAAGAAYGGYAGRWEVDEGRGEVLHHVETAFVPNRVGRTIRRSYSFKEDLLFLRPIALSPRDAAPDRILRWRRRDVASEAIRG